MLDSATVTDRRSLILGLGTRRDRAAAQRESSIASVLVQTKPEHLAAVETALARLAGCELHGRDPRGKLVVVIDAADTGVVGTTLNAIAATPRVLSAALVFHAIDVARASDTEDTP